MLKYTLGLYKKCQVTPRRWKGFLKREGDFYGCPPIIMFVYLRDYKEGKDPKKYLNDGKGIFI